MIFENASKNFSSLFLSNHQIIAYVKKEKIMNVVKSLSYTSGIVGLGFLACAYTAILSGGNQIKRAAEQLQNTNHSNIERVIPRNARSSADLAGRIAATARNVADAGVADAASATQTVIKSLK